MVTHAFVKISRARHKDGDGERWGREDVAPTLNLFDCGDARTTTIFVTSRK